MALGAIVAFCWLVFDTLLRAASPGERAASIDAMLADWSALGSVPGVIIRIEQSGELLFAGAAGQTRRKGGLPVRPDTPFHIASDRDALPPRSAQRGN